MMRNIPAIIGIVLVKNEDLFIDRVLTNILDFCDEIIVADNLSKDGTQDTVRALQQHHSKIHYHSIASPAQSHDLICGYAGTNTWIFAVDGDEIYDPLGLKRLRQRINAGEYDRQWMILGNALNCVALNVEKGYVQGYLAPPCRSMTKLYNFNAIKAWEGPCSERLHGGEMLFKEGYDKSQRLERYKDTSWDEAEFRALHLCFLRRSTLEKASDSQKVIRKNISDMLSENIWARITSRFFKFIGKEQKSPWKLEKYMRGQLVTKPLTPFL
ncbi:MAG: glycosyltransferase [Candidatus Electrothrix sp. GW3-4]|uniref:glycosyltransferase n=1 Tax=Candidatus Electrothrix sp. GW3-4 TaxID=3126740 RepID=UPI0030CA8843